MNANFNPPQFGLRTLFCLTTLCAVTLPFVIWRGPLAAVVALPLASTSAATWCCLRACWRADSMPLRLWFLLGAGLSLALCAVAVSITVTS